MIRQFSVGGVVYRREGKGIVWLVRKSSAGEGYGGTRGWNLPKGWIDDEDGGKKPGQKTLGIDRATKQEMEEAAVREVAEEGGVRAKVLGRLGEVRVFFHNKEKERVFKTIIFYLMEYEGDLEEGIGWETEEVRWVDMAEAERVLEYKNEREMIEKAMTRVRKEGGE